MFIEAGTVVPYLFAFVGHVVPGRTIATGRSNWMASSFEIDEPCVEECVPIYFNYSLLEKQSF